MKIPKIIHQTWKTSDIPGEYHKWVESWKRHNPGYEFHLWTDEDNRNLIAKEFPEFLHLYDSLPLKIHRVDIIRYFILFSKGGIYADLDFECLKPLGPLLAEHELVVASEPKVHCENLYKRPRLICNAWMASTVRHPFWIALIQEINNRFRNTDSVLDLTGPMIMDDVFSQAQFHPDVYKMYEARSELLYPLFGSAKPSDKGLSSRLMKEAYCAHHWKNSWTGQKPITREFDGFYFYPGQDSVFNDIHHAESLDGAYHYAKSHQEAVAFNTDNNVKSAIPELRPYWASDKGIFIKRPANPKFEDYELMVDSDIENSDICRFVMKDMNDLKKIADQNPWCLAFNTHGYLKYDCVKLKQAKGISVYIKKNIAIPQIVPGFRFIPYRDSYGNDIGKEGLPLLKAPSTITSTNPLDFMIIENIKQLAEKCKSNPAAVAFNLDGMMKSKISSVEQMSVAQLYRLQGIFIKNDT